MYIFINYLPQQIKNKDEDFKKNILAAAGLLQEDKSIAEQFEQVAIRYVDLSTGKFTEAPSGFDQRKAAKIADQSVALSGAEDIAKIRRREHIAEVYLIEENGELKTIILPVRGAGLWSTLYGFIALSGDLNTVAGFGFYEHAETPGLGGEVDNPKWKADWIGKKVYKGDDVALGVIKGKVVNLPKEQQEYAADGLSGATLTSKGVHNLIEFWMGNKGFKPFINNLKAGGA